MQVMRFLPLHERRFVKRLGSWRLEITGTHSQSEMDLPKNHASTTSMFFFQGEYHHGEFLSHLSPFLEKINSISS